MKICFYLSDHGFGHIARNIPIMKALLKRQEIQLFVVCGKNHINFAKENLTEEECNRVTLRVMHTDIGLLLKANTLLVDPEVLERETSQFLSICKERSKEEASWLTMEGIDRVVCDMPIWAIEAAKQANIPLLYIGNFTWVELYREHLPVYIWSAYEKEYAKIEHAYLYALHNEEMKTILTCPFVEGSVLCRDFDEAFAKNLRMQYDKPCVFVALGMSANFKEEVNVEQLPYYFFVNEGVPLVGANVTKLSINTKNTQDYVLASDYVITKAGWGTVSEALLAKKPMALFARDTVLEDRNTISILKQQKLAISLTEEDLKNIPEVIARMNREIKKDNLCLYYDCREELAEKIVGLR